MKLRLWWVPLLLLLAPLLGRVPEPRDVPGFFAPIRSATSARLSLGEWPWLNAANGCTEAWFANPETGVLYPPAWPHLILRSGVAMSLEIGLHLALLALGAGLLAKKLGTAPEHLAIVEAATWSSGAVLAMAGMLNNLEALSWLPWMILAARLPGRWTVPATAAACSLGWLAGEPVVWAFGTVLAIALAGRRRRMASLGLALSILAVSVQIVPFLSWVLEGDRGGGPAIQYLSGSVSPTGWLRLLVPGVPATGQGTPWAASLFLGAPLVLLAFLGIRRHPWIAGVAAGLAILATLPSLGDGSLYLSLTRSLVRYPSRFAVLAVAILLPFIGPGARRWIRGEGRLLAWILGLASLGSLSMAVDATGIFATAIPAGALLAGAAFPRSRRLRGAAVILGLLAALIAGWPLLGLQQPWENPWPWPGTAGTGRLYTPPPSGPARAWLANTGGRLSLWPLGYHNLDAGVELVRSNAPLLHHRLALHLSHADRGPAGRWWLDTLAAPWMILPNAPPPGQGLRPVRSLGGMWLAANLHARPWASAWLRPPVEGAALAPATVTVMRTRAEHLVVFVASQRATWLGLSLPPVRGWHFFLDENPVDPEPGPGILQLVQLPTGSHRLEGRYLPPGFPATPILSGFALLLTALLAMRAWTAKRRPDHTVRDVAS